MESVSAMEVKFLWGNYFFDHIISEASGNSGGILCAWDTNFFKKDHHTISDNFIALYGTWIPNNQKLLIISVYAPQSVSSKRMLWSYLESLITSWNGESLIMGDFNEVRCIEERWGSVFNSHGANAFNSFISNSGLNDIQLEGFSFTWVHPSATKMSKLDRFLMSNGLLSAFPLISAICLDRHLSDHRPILLKEVFSDFGPTPFRFYHSWLELPGFDDLVSKFWNSFTLDDSNGMIRFKKKLQMLKKEIRAWTLDFKRHQVGLSKDLKSKLCDIDKVLIRRSPPTTFLLSRLESLETINHDVQSITTVDSCKRPKISGAIEGDENSNYFHAIIKQKTRKSFQLGILVDGDVIGDCRLWILLKEFRKALYGHIPDPGSVIFFGGRYPRYCVLEAAKSIGCLIMKAPFNILAVSLVGRSFWKDLWIGDNLLKLSFPRLFALKKNKDISVADKMNTSISSSFRRHVRGGVESQQLDQLSILLDTVILSNMDDRWFWDLNGDGVFQVKDVRSMLDEAFLPKMEVPTRWIKSILIKVNVFAWKLYLDRLL
ncbi:RNA-directed DNA polymerase, eukaryota [Tanacetum coccineum]